MNRSSSLDPSLLVDNPRATMRAWKQYETCAVAAFHQHPKPYIFTPTTHRPTTVASRIRDAIRGCLAFAYPILSDPPIGHDALREWWSSVIVKNTATLVIIGVPERVLVEMSGDVSAPASGGLAFQTLSLEEIIAFTILISTGRISGPIVVTTPPDVSLIPERPNVEMDVRADGKLLIL